MTAAEWQTSTDPAKMLAFLMGGCPQDHLPPSMTGRPSDRKLRLFACACARQVWERMPDNRGRRAVEAAEKYADGEATQAQMDLAFAKFNPVTRNEHSETWLLTLRCSWSGRHIAEGVKQTYRYLSLVTQAALLRCIFGSPFRPVVTDPKQAVVYNPGGGLTTMAGYRVVDLRTTLAWNGGTVVRMAETIYADWRWEDLGVLADALEESGCGDAQILAHLRGPGPHTRGCWCVDLVLGKS